MQTRKKKGKLLLPEKVDKPLQFLPAKRMADTSGSLFFFFRSPGNILWIGRNSLWLPQEYLWHYILHMGFLLLYESMDMVHLPLAKHASLYCAVVKNDPFFVSDHFCTKSQELQIIQKKHTIVLGVGEKDHWLWRSISIRTQAASPSLNLNGVPNRPVQRT